MVILSPDVGGVERAKAFIKRLEKIQQRDPKEREYTLALISKTRAKAGEIENMQLIGDVSGKNVIIIDDIIDSGKTLCRASDILKQNGAQKIFCYATHGIFTNGTTELSNCFDAIMCSNTHHIEDRKIEIIDITPVFAEAIYRAQKGMSISKLFRT